MLLYYFASAVKSIQFHVDDDIIDKLNYYYTTSIITGNLLFSLFILHYKIKVKYPFTDNIAVSFEYKSKISFNILKTS